MSEVAWNTTTTITTDEIVDLLDRNDDQVFTFIWDLLENEHVGTEVKERLFEQLQESLRLAGFLDDAGQLVKKES